MANRSELYQIRQLGREVTPGTAVAANLIDPNLKLMIEIAGDASQEITATGYAYPSSVVSGMYWGAGTYDVPGTFTGLQIVLDSLLKKVTATGSNLTKTRVWGPAVNAPDTHQTYSAESGQTGAVEKFKNLFFNDLKWTIGKQTQSNITGNVLAQVQNPFLDTSLTGSPTVLPSSVIPKISWNCYTADTFAHLASAPTQQLDQFEYGLAFGPVFETAALINSSNPSWDAAGQGAAPKNTVDVTVPSDVSSGDYAGLFTLAKKLAGTPIFVRLAAQGQFIETVSSVDYYEQVIIDMCLRIVGNPKAAKVGPFVGKQWPCVLSVDPTSGLAWQVTTMSAVP